MPAFTELQLFMVQSVPLVLNVITGGGVVKPGSVTTALFAGPKLLVTVQL